MRKASIYALILLWVNAYICRNLFFTEFTAHTNSIQGLWISMARLAGEHWYRPAWWPYHDGGIPFEHTYMPLVPAATAIYAKLGHVSAWRAFNAITGIIYCLGPLTLFALAWQLTRSAGYAFWAALLYSLTSPARALVPDPTVNLSLMWTSRRLYTLVVWDDVPHAAAMCFMPLMILFLWRALTNRRPVDYLLSGLFMALSVLASVFGAIACLLSAFCMLFALQKRQYALTVAAIGIAAYLVVCPFLPPSLIATIRSNQQIFPEDRWSVSSLTALGMVALGWAIVWWMLSRWSKNWYLRFFVLLAFLASSIPLIEAFTHRHFLPQAGRYQPEMEFALPLAFVFLLRPQAEKLPRGVKMGLTLLLLSFAGEQIVSFRRYAKEVTFAVDVTRSIEYRVAKWVDRNLPGQRVMVPGSIAQWFNAFSDAPQLSGGSYSTTPNWTQQDAMTTILTGRDGAESLLWLKAFGIQAVTVVGPKSTEFWKPYANPGKFEGLLPVLWREDDVTIYKVPQRSPSLAHVTRAGAPDLRAYVAALDDPSLPNAEMRWDGFRQASIRAEVKQGQIVAVQTNYHPGWHAIANGRPAEVRRDALGLLSIWPRCDGPCEIDLSYDGGWEYRLCRWISALTLLGVCGTLLRLRRLEGRPRRK